MWCQQMLRGSSFFLQTLMHVLLLQFWYAPVCRLTETRHYWIYAGIQCSTTSGVSHVPMIFILFDYGCSVTCTQVVSHLIHSPMYSPKVLLLHMNQKHYWDHLPRNYKSLNSQHRTMFTQDNKYKAEALNQTLEEQSTSPHHTVVEKIWSGVWRYSVQAAPRCPESCLSS
jgi:hypothetical protein